LEAFSGDSLENFSIGLAGAEPGCAPAMTSVPWRRPRGKGRWVHQPHQPHPAHLTHQPHLTHLAHLPHQT